MASPIPDVNMVRQVRELRYEGYSFRQIAALLKKDVKSVHRWAQYSFTLSTGSR